MKTIWSIGLVTVYVYAATILAYVGYFEYYGIPSYFVSSSIQANVTYFFVILKALFTVIWSIGWWFLLSLALFAALIYWVYTKNKFSRYAITTMVIFGIACLLYGSYNLGKKIAEANPVFLISTADCEAFGTSTDYYGIGGTENREIFIHSKGGPYNPDSFIVKDLSSVDCAFHNQWFERLKI